jgi:hypothetical protein
MYNSCHVILHTCLREGGHIPNSKSPHLLLDSINVGRSIEFQNFKGYQRYAEKRLIDSKKDAKRSRKGKPKGKLWYW